MAAAGQVCTVPRMTAKSMGAPRLVKPAINCAHCGCQAEWVERFGAYMHFDEAQEDTHAVVVLAELGYRPPAPEPLRHPLWTPENTDRSD